jgi:hypothetical protein
MTRRTAIAALSAVPLVLGSRGGAGSAAQETWTPLFSGIDLRGWDTYLGKPFPGVDIPGEPRDERGAYLQPVGLNRDPSRVFSVVSVDGEPAIRISGEVYGALTTRAEHENYHLRFEFKWGERRWSPRAQAVRDSGCLYHAVGQHGASYGFWMQSFEFQIQEGDCGDFYGLAGVLADAEAVSTDPGNPKSDPIYRKGAPLAIGVSRRIVKDADHEKPRGQWNALELYCVGSTSAHVVNGRVAMILTGLRRTVDGREVPLRKGRIQLQSEAAEVFYRRIAIRRIDALPPSILA